MAYHDTHRAFLQAMMPRPYVDANKAKELIALIKTKERLQTGVEGVIDAGEVSNQDMNDFITKVDDAIHPYDLAIRNMVDQKKGKRVWALINTADDDIIRLATTHSADEIAFFKRLLDAMFDTYNTHEAEVYAIKSMQALALNKNPQPDRPAAAANVDNDEDDGDQDAAAQQQATQITGIGPGLTKKEAEEALGKFADEGWLNITEKQGSSWYHLSSRALLELELYLMQMYNVADEEGEKVERIKHCSACSEIHTIGLRCENLECHFRIHNHCKDNYFRSRDKKCPKCNVDFSGERPVGPNAGRDLPTAAAAARNRRRTTGVGANEDANRSLPRSESRTASASNESDNNLEAEHMNDENSPPGTEVEAPGSSQTMDSSE